jgi:hypothetical protein
MGIGAEAGAGGGIGERTILIASYRDTGGGGGDAELILRLVSTYLRDVCRSFSCISISEERGRLILMTGSQSFRRLKLAVIRWASRAPAVVSTISLIFAFPHGTLHRRYGRRLRYLGQSNQPIAYRHPQIASNSRHPSNQP